MHSFTLPTEKKTYSRNELFEFLRLQKTELTQNSFNWIISDFQKHGFLFKVSSDTYSLTPCNKPSYKPLYSESTTKLITKLSEVYPDVKFIVFESFLLNEFVNHQIAQNTIVVMAEKDYCEYIFDHLNDEYSGKVLLSPDKENLHRYWSDNCIIVERLVSEPPQHIENPHFISIEKLLVDSIADKIVSELFTHSEYEFIFEESFDRYNVDIRKMKRYANRRNAWEAISKHIKESK